MYSENSEKLFSVRNFILKVILVILFVFLLMWLFPMPNLQPVYDRIFADNIATMKDAAKSYFTVERLPKDVGKSVKLTLDEMLSMKLLLPLADSDNKLCDGKSSYVEVMKTENEYLIKVNLSCPNRSGYIIEHMGCYDICSDKCVVSEPEEVIKKPTTNKPPVKPPVKPPIKPPVNPPVTKYEYQYLKTTPSSYAYWGDWSNEIPIKLNESITFGIVSTSNGTVENKDLGTKETIVEYKTYYKTLTTREITRQINYTVGSYTVNACDGYTYYRTSTGTTYRGTWTTAAPTGKHYIAPPSDTDAEIYSNIQIHYDLCDSTCTLDKIYFTANVSKLSGTVVSSATSGTIDTICSNPTSKTVAVKGTVTQKVIIPATVQKISEPIYNMVHYYQQRKLLYSSSSYTDYKWSANSNDTTLINQGYRATGTKREVK
jgi:hypothetical protein